MGSWRRWCLGHVQERASAERNHEEVQEPAETTGYQHREGRLIFGDELHQRR